MKRIITVVSAVAAVMAMTIVIGAGGALAQSFEIIERGSPKGATVELWRWEDLTEGQSFYLSELGFDECAGGDALVTASASGFARRVYAPSGQETRTVHARREVSFELDGVLYTGTLRNEFSFEDVSGANGHIVDRLMATGSDGSTIRAIAFTEVVNGVESTQVMCPGN